MYVGQAFSGYVPVFQFLPWIWVSRARIKPGWDLCLRLCADVLVSYCESISSLEFNPLQWKCWEKNIQATDMIGKHHHFFWHYYISFALAFSTPTHTWMSEHHSLGWELLFLCLYLSASESKRSLPAVCSHTNWLCRALKGCLYLHFKCPGLVFHVLV